MSGNNCGISEEGGFRDGHALFIFVSVRLSQSFLKEVEIETGSVHICFLKGSVSFLSSVF